MPMYLLEWERDGHAQGPPSTWALPALALWVQGDIRQLEPVPKNKGGYVPHTYSPYKLGPTVSFPFKNAQIFGETLANS